MRKPNEADRSSLTVEDDTFFISSVYHACPLSKTLLSRIYIAARERTTDSNLLRSKHRRDTFQPVLVNATFQQNHRRSHCKETAHNCLDGCNIAGEDCITFFSAVTVFVHRDHISHSACAAVSCIYATKTSIKHAANTRAHILEGYVI